MFPRSETRARALSSYIWIFFPKDADADLERVLQIPQGINRANQGTWLACFEGNRTHALCKADAAQSTKNKGEQGLTDSLIQLGRVSLC